MSSEHKLIYQQEWENYDDQRAVGCVLFIVLLLIVVLFRFVFADMIKGFETYLVFLIVPLMIISAYVSYKYAFKCPRCRKNFQPYRRYYFGQPLDRCIHCNLPKFFGSAKFYDYWGTERGDKLVKEFGAQGDNY